MIDLHIHTTASDGQYTPVQIVKMSREIGLKMISITDHDTVNGLDEGKTEAKRIGIRFIPGIEISTQDIEEIHILGYNIDPHDRRLGDACKTWEQSRLNRGDMICEYLNSIGISVDIEEVKRKASGNLGRPHFAAYLLEHGIVSTRKEAFDKYLDTEEFREATDRKKPDPEYAIDLIHGAGGKAVLAHPGIYRMDEEQLIDLFDRLVGLGIDGIECFYSRHTEDQRLEYIEYAMRHCLVSGCGSDFHGEKVKPDIKLGMVFDEKCGLKLVC